MRDLAGVGLQRVLRDQRLGGKIDDGDIRRTAGQERALPRVETVAPRAVGADQVVRAPQRQAPPRHRVEHRGQDDLDPGAARGRAGEVALGGLFLGLGERGVIGGDVIDDAVGDGLPERILVRLEADRRVDLGVDAGPRHVRFGREQVLGAGLGGEGRTALHRPQDSDGLGRGDVRDMELRARRHVHRQELGDGHRFADRGAGQVVRRRVGRIERLGHLAEMPEEGRTLGVHHDRQPGGRQQAQRAQLVGLVGEGEAVELVAAPWRRLGREDLPGDAAEVDHAVAARFGQVAGRGVEREVDHRVLGEVVAAAGQFLGGRTAGLRDRHLEDRRHAPGRGGAGFRPDRAALGVGGGADVEVDVDDARQHVPTRRVERLGRRGRGAGQVDPRDTAVPDAQVGPDQAVGHQDVAPGDEEIETAHFSPSSVSACATPSRFVSFIEA